MNQGTKIDDWAKPIAAPGNWFLQLQRTVHIRCSCVSYRCLSHAVHLALLCLIVLSVLDCYLSRTDVCLVLLSVSSREDQCAQDSMPKLQWLQQV